MSLFPKKVECSFNIYIIYNFYKTVTVPTKILHSTADFNIDINSIKLAHYSDF